MEYKCNKCGSVFQPTQSAISHHMWTCKQCVKIDNAAKLQRRKALGLRTGGKVSREWYQKYYKKYMSKPENRKRASENQKRYRNDPILRMRHEARWQANRALISGKITKSPCVKCGEEKSEMHHHDYYKPLDVIWLCRKCHIAEHAKATANQ